MSRGDLSPSHIVLLTSEQIAQHIEYLKTLDMTGYEVEKQGWIQQWEKALTVQKQWELNQNKNE